MSPVDVHPIDPSLPLDPLPGHSSRGRLERILRRGEFAVTAELNPPEDKRAQIEAAIKQAGANPVSLAKCVDRLRTLVAEKGE